ncbi:MAG: hypothetical protein KC877_02375, partial [Candidatus Kaiserbacteria bacterium]|nr:hypothetical protein [Candidatus Kaiserbacteria bacterium]
MNQALKSDSMSKGRVVCYGVVFFMEVFFAVLYVFLQKTHVSHQYSGDVGGVLCLPSYFFVFQYWKAFNMFVIVVSLLFLFAGLYKWARKQQSVHLFKMAFTPLFILACIGIGYLMSTSTG